MAWTTAAAFTEFLGKLEPTTTQQDLIKTRRRIISEQLFAHFHSGTTPPVERVDIIGSADRGTIIRPIHDIDLLAVFSAYAYHTLYWPNPRGFITRVRDALNEGGAYVVGTRGQAVRIFYQSGPKVDVAPVFPIAGGGYYLSDGSGGWMTTNPDFHRHWIARRHRELGYHLKPLAKAIKRWNRVHSERLSSFHIEVMVASIFSSMNGDYRDAASLFFNHAANYLHVYDPAGHSGDLAAKLTHDKQLAITQSFNSAKQRACNAVAAEARGDHAEAIRLWRIVFGEEFPNYG
jgi:hypothetical protein